MSIFLVDSYGEANHSQKTLTEILRPNADGDVIELINTVYTQVDNWSYVDEAVADGITTAVQNTDYYIVEKDLYNFPAHSGSGTINKITVYAKLFTEQPPGDYARIAIKTGGTVYYSGNLVTTLWELKSYTWTVNPQTGLAWTWTDIDALQIGIELYSVSGGNGSFCTQLYVEVDYTIPSPKVAHSFTGKDGDITNAKFYLKKFGSPTGNIVAKLYSHSGTFGISSVPNILRATSDNIDIATLDTNFNLITFSFTGAEQYTLVDDIKYCIEVEYTDGDDDNGLIAGHDNTTLGHSGNYSYYDGGWVADSDLDLIFYVYAEGIEPVESSGVALSTLTLKSLKRTREINGAWYVDLQCLPDEILGFESYIDVEGESYIVKRFDQIVDENGEYYYDITAYLNFIELGKLTIDRFYRTDTVANLLAYILDGTDWTAGDCDIGEILIFEEPKRGSRLKALNDLATQCSGELNWHSKTQVVDLLREIGTNTGLHLRVDKNCTSIKREVDSTDLCTRIYPIGPDNFEINSTIVDACEDETDYAPSGAGTTEASDFKFQGSQAIKLNSVTLNETFINDLAVLKDLSDHDTLKFDIYSETANALGFTFGIGEAAYTENTVNTGALEAGCKKEVTLDLSGVANANKNAIRYIGLENLTNGAVSVVIDNIRAFYGDTYIDSPNISLYKTVKDYVYNHSAKPEKTQYEKILYPTEDAYESGSIGPNTNYGNATVLKAHNEGNPGQPVDQRRSVMKFSLSDIPAGATIVSATMHIHLNKSCSDEHSTTVMKVATSAWSESLVTWNTHPSVGDTIYNWQMAGQGIGWKNDSGAMTDTVQNWLNETLSNYGVTFEWPTSDCDEIEWDSREGINKPYMVVVYTLETDPTPIIIAAALDYLYSHDEPKISYKAKMADLSKVMADTWEDEEINLGDTLRAYDAILDFNTGVRALKTVENLLDPSDIDLELANKAYTSVDMEVERAKQLKAAMPYDDNPKIIDANAIQQGYLGGDVG